MVSFDVFSLMDPTKTPHLACVTVSTTEKRCTASVSGCPPHVEVSPAEQYLIGALVQDFGWTVAEPGVLRRLRFSRRAL